MDRRRKQELSRDFGDADKDKNGFLSLKELKTLLKKQGYNWSASKVKARFKEFDLNGDKKISLEEYLACMGMVPEVFHEEAVIRKMFRAYDQNGDGLVDRAELHEVFRATGRKLKEPDVDRMFRCIDADGSGKIDYDEFLTFFSKSYADHAVIKR